jgi:hypothetical protein
LVVSGAEGQARSIQDSLWNIPIHDLPLKPDWPLSLQIVRQVGQLTEVGIVALLLCSQEQVDGVLKVIVFDELLDAGREELLARLRLPGQHSIGGDGFFKLVA